MTTALQVFNFLNEGDGHEIRVVMQGGEPWWVAKDVCDVLEVGNTSDAIRRLDDDERTLVSIEGASNGLPVNAINEAGLYTLVLTSRKPQAKVFKRWITHEVIPSIRKTGAYSVQQKPLSAIEQIQLLLQATSEQHQEVAAVKQEVVEVRQDVEKLKQTTTLTSSQQRRVQNAVNKKVVEGLELLGNQTVSKRDLYAELYREIKNRWGVGSYRDLPCVELDNAMAYIEAWRPRIR